MIIEPTFAKMAPAIIHTPGLFTSHTKDSLERSMNLVHMMGGILFRFSGPQLSSVELRVLQGLVGFAGLQRRGSDVVNADEPLDDVERLLCHRVAIRVTCNQLAEVIGYRANSGSAQSAIRTAIEKLGSVEIGIRSASSLDAPNLSAGRLIVNDTSSRRVDVVLSSVLGAAVHGGRGKYLRTDLLEVRQLGSDAARLLHHRLHWINTGSSRDVSLDKMIGYVWPSMEVSCSAYRTRRQVLRHALSQLIILGWTVTSRGDLFQIGRPAAKAV